MIKWFHGSRSKFFIFYAVTYFGSALTSVSSFFMVEHLANSLSVLGFALALKTGCMALASPWIASKLSRVSMKMGFWASQILGILFLLPLAVGIYLHSLPIFIVGLTIGGIPNLMLVTAGTAYLKLNSRESLDQFRKDQGVLQLVISLCFMGSAIISPLLLKWFSYHLVLGLDVVTYLLGAIYIYLNKDLNQWDSAPTAADRPKVEGEQGDLEKVSKASYLSASAISAFGSIVIIYLLKGLPPMMAGNPSMTDSLGIATTARQLLWSTEAFAGIVSGLLYRYLHANARLRRSFDLGYVNGLLLLVAFVVPNIIGLSFGLFAMSLTMTLTYMKVRDDFIALFTKRSEVIWATGLINLATNLTLTISPLAIGVVADAFGISVLIAISVFLQVMTLIVVWFSFDNQIAKAELFKKLRSISTKSMLIFIVVTCTLLTSVLYTFEKTRALRQIEIWKRTVAKSVIPQLIESDYVPIFAKLNLIRETGLFSEFAIFDNQKKQVAAIGQVNAESDILSPILDEAGSVWGYYSFTPNRMYWWKSTAVIVPIIMVVLMFTGLVTRQLMLRRLQRETLAIDDFIRAIEDYAHSISRSENTSELPPFIQKPQNVSVDELHRISSVVENLAQQIQHRQVKAVQSAQIAQLSRQVAHDIRSPLSALNMVMCRTNEISTERRDLIRNAIQRINDIANDLLAKGTRKGQTGHHDQELLHVVVDSITSEKQLQSRSITFTRDLDSLFGVFSAIPRGELQRVFSNIIDNAVDAITEENGEVHIVARMSSHAIVSIRDNGKGIPQDVVDKIGAQGFSFGKCGRGYGLGIYGARRIVENYGGQLIIQSKEGFGTQVDIHIPIAPAPRWIAKSLPISDCRLVVSLDDDRSIHKIWQQRFEPLDVPFKKFFGISAFESWFKHVAKEDLSKITFLIDYDINDHFENGLQLIERLRLPKTILITSKYLEEEVIAGSDRLNISILPKNLADAVPLV